MSDWATRSLKEVCIIKPPKKEAKELLSPRDKVSFVPMNCLEAGPKYFLPESSRPLESVSGSYTYFADGDVLLAKITPCFENGKVGIARKLENGIGFGSSEFVVYRPSSELSPEFLFYFFSQNSFRKEGERRMGGAVGHKRIQKDFIEGKSIPVPPLPEQERIVAILDEAFEGIATATAHAERNLHNARELFQSVLQSTFEQKGEDWVETTLGEVCGFQNGFTFKSAKFRDSGVPILRISNIQDDKIDTRKIVFTDPDDYTENLDRYLISKGDLLIAMSGATTGKIGFNTTDKTFLLNQRVGKFEPGERLEKRFLYFYLLTQVEENLRISAGAAQPNLSTSQIKGFQIPLPSTEAQKAIVQKLDALAAETRRLEAVYQRKLDALAELKQSLLQRAFAGEL